MQPTRKTFKMLESLLETQRDALVDCQFHPLEFKITNHDIKLAKKVISHEDELEYRHKWKLHRDKKINNDQNLMAATETEEDSDYDYLLIDDQEDMDVDEFKTRVSKNIEKIMNIVTLLL